MSNEPGSLYVVATPIGNLEDIGGRALRVLAGVDLVLAEDTRHSGGLLRHFGIRRPLQSLHEHNERARVESLIARLEAGGSLALISDAGTPLISDPGYHLVRAAHGAGVPVVPVPGPSAVTCALCAAGLPGDRFVFEGFLPARAAERRRRLQALAGETRTLVFCEAPHRIAAALRDLAAVLGTGREALLARELTKLHETLRAATLGELAAWLAASPAQRRGEIVLVVRGAPEEARQEQDVQAGRTLEVLLEALPLSQAVTLAARITGVPRNRLYREAIARTAPARDP